MSVHQWRSRTLARRCTSPKAHFPTSRRPSAATGLVGLSARCWVAPETMQSELTGSLSSLVPKVRLKLGLCPAVTDPAPPPPSAPPWPSPVAVVPPSCRRVKNYIHLLFTTPPQLLVHERQLSACGVTHNSRDLYLFLVIYHSPFFHRAGEVRPRPRAACLPPATTWGRGDRKACAGSPLCDRPGSPRFGSLRRMRRTAPRVAPCQATFDFQYEPRRSRRLRTTVYALLLLPHILLAPGELMPYRCDLGTCR